MKDKTSKEKNNKDKEPMITGRSKKSGKKGRSGAEDLSSHFPSVVPSSSVSMTLSPVRTDLPTIRSTQAPSVVPAPTSLAPTSTTAPGDESVSNRPPTDDEPRPPRDVDFGAADTVPFKMAKDAAKKFKNTERSGGEVVLTPPTSPATEDSDDGEEEETFKRMKDKFKKQGRTKQESISLPSSEETSTVSRTISPAPSSMPKGKRFKFRKANDGSTSTSIDVEEARGEGRKAPHAGKGFKRTEPRTKKEDEQDERI